MNKKLLNYLTFLFLLFSMVSVSNKFVYGQTTRLECEDAAWTATLENFTTGWTTRTGVGSVGIGASSSGSTYRARYFKFNLPSGVYNVDLGWYDNAVSSTASSLWLQIGQRTIKNSPPQTQIPAMDIDESWLADQAATGLYIRNYTNVNLDATDTIFLFHFENGAGNRSWFDYIDFTLITSTGLKNQSQILPEFSVYPNPVTDRASITFATDKKTSISMELMNIIGQSVKNIVDADFEAGKHTINFDRQGLTSGMYYLKAEYDGKVFITKIILSK